MAQGVVSNYGNWMNLTKGYTNTTDAYTPKMDVAIDGSAVAQTALSTLTDYPLYLAQQIRETGSPILQEIVERGEIIFNENIDIPGAGPYKSAAQG